MTTVLMLREELDRLKRRRMDLVLRADASIRAAKELLAASSVRELQDIDLKTANGHLQQAITAQDELAEVLKKMRTLEKELGL